MIDLDALEKYAKGALNVHPDTKSVRISPRVLLELVAEIRKLRATVVPPSK